MVKNLLANVGDMRFGFHLWAREIPQRRAWQLTPVFLPEESHGQRSLIGSSEQFSSVAQSCPTLFDPMDCSMPGFPVHHQLQELTQIHVHWVSDAIQLSPSPSAFNLSQYQGLFKWVSSLHQVAKVLEFQLQHQSFQQILRTDFL